MELLFFSSQQKLLNAMSPLYSRLTEEELNRNKHGPCLLYTFDSTLNFPVSSSLPGKFPDLSCCHARYEFLWHEHSDTTVLSIINDFEGDKRQIVMAGNIYM